VRCRAPAHDDGKVRAAANPLRFDHMQSWMKSLEQQDRTALLRGCLTSQLELTREDPTTALLEAEQQERRANSKLDRLADELRALGIRF
jgi:hypothetical protein